MTRLFKRACEPEQGARLKLNLGRYGNSFRGLGHGVDMPSGVDYSSDADFFPVTGIFSIEAPVYGVLAIA